MMAMLRGDRDKGLAVVERRECELCVVRARKRRSTSHRSFASAVDEDTYRRIAAAASRNSACHARLDCVYSGETRPNRAASTPGANHRAL